MALLTFLEQVLQAQEHRARSYSAFERGFKSFLESKDDGIYASACKAATESFQFASQKIRQLLDEMKGPGSTRNDSEKCIISMVEELQQLEKKKLEMTAHIQRTKTKYFIQLKDPDNPLYIRERNELVSQLRQVVEQINDILDELRAHMLENKS